MREYNEAALMNRLIYEPSAEIGPTHLSRLPGFQAILCN